MNLMEQGYTVPSTDGLPGLDEEPIPAAPYHDPDHFELEREAIFKRSWLQIGHVCELPEIGDFMVRPIEIAKASILVARGKDGGIRAFHNVCTHRGTTLVSEASGNRSSFSCRYHGWTFGNDGKLRSAPDFERFYVEKSECSLPEIAVEICAGLIFINLDPSPRQSLKKFLGPMGDRLEALPVARATTFSECTYEIEANWKTVYDNFQESYHLRFVHPRTGKANLGPENPFGYIEKYAFDGVHRAQTLWSNPSPQVQPLQGFILGKVAEFTMATEPVGAQICRDYNQVFPNFLIFGLPMQHFSHTVFPISPTRSRGVLRTYWIGDDDSATKRFAREYSFAGVMDVHAEDRPAIEAAQEGLNSGALEFVHFQEQEASCRHMYRTIEGMVRAYREESGADS